MVNNNPKVKAEAIKTHMRDQLGLKTDVDIVMTSRAYVGRLLEDMPLLHGDYKLEYQENWPRFTSYWYQVIDHLQF